MHARLGFGITGLARSLRHSGYPRSRDGRNCLFDAVTCRGKIVEPVARRVPAISTRAEITPVPVAEECRTSKSTNSSAASAQKWKTGRCARRKRSGDECANGKSQVGVFRSFRPAESSSLCTCIRTWTRTDGNFPKSPRIVCACRSVRLYRKEANF